MKTIWGGTEVIVNFSLVVKVMGILERKLFFLGSRWKPSIDLPLYVAGD